MENILKAVTDGTIITIVGMVVVFAFLIIMVYAMDLTAAIVRYLNKKFPPKVVETTTVKKKAPAGEEEAVAVAIAAVLNFQRTGR
ncbi:TPA: OadG family protein [Candidatus Galligastranaerophilus faecipullorum]|nr:OadG family protein [Candidatus Galligastranaerophilus faecipullorum]